MKGKDGLILVGLLLAITVLLASVFALPTIADDCGCCYQQPTMVTQGLDNDGKVTMTVTTSVPDEYYRSELGTIGCSLEEHRAVEGVTRNEIMTNPQVTVDFYVYGVGYYPCAINRITGEITVTLTGDNVPPVGSWVALRFCNVECDIYDQTVYAPLKGTLLNEWKTPKYGQEIPLTVLGLSPIYC